MHVKRSTKTREVCAQNHSDMIQATELVIQNHDLRQTPKNSFLKLHAT